MNGRRIGGMSLDLKWHTLARVNATVPLAVLRFDRAGLSIGPVPPFGRLIPSATVDLEQVSSIFVSLGILTRGVGVATTAGRVHYFWTWRSRSVVKALASLGFPIGNAARTSGLDLVRKTFRT